MSPPSKANMLSNLVPPPVDELVPPTPPPIPGPSPNLDARDALPGGFAKGFAARSSPVRSNALASLSFCRSHLRSGRSSLLG